MVTKDTISNRPRPLSDLVPGLTKHVFGSKNILFGKLLADWVQVVGPELGSRTMPLDLKFAGVRPKKGANISAIPGINSKPQAVLHLAVQPGYALELSYQTALLIERLNIYFGYTAIKDIKIVQHSEVMSSKPLPAAVTRPLSAEEDSRIDGIVAGVQKNDLQTALKNLGKSIASRVKKGQEA